MELENEMVANYFLFPDLFSSSSFVLHVMNMPLKKYLIHLGENNMDDKQRAQKRTAELSGVIAQHNEKSRADQKHQDM